LAAVAAMVPPGVPMADIGTDHAHLPIALVKWDHTPWAVATDVREGPCRRAQQAVHAAGLSHRIDVRLGDGLKALEQGEVHTVVMAGMGGVLMDELLRADPEKTRSFQRLVLQPNMASHRLRTTLLGQQWKLLDEQLVFDEGYVYEILTYEPGSDDAYAAAAETLARQRELAFIKDDWFLLYLLGPRLLQKAWEAPDDGTRQLLLMRMEEAAEKRRRILAGLKRARHTAERQKIGPLTNQLAQLEVLAQCMRTGKP